VEPWTRRLSDWARALAPVVSLSFDAAGHPRLAEGLEARAPNQEGERALLERVLNRIDAVAGEERFFERLEVGPIEPGHLAH
jgi:hypothetical protein